MTGGSRGIGAAVAIALARAGADVAVNYRERADAANAVCCEITRMGRKAIAVQADVSVAADVRRMVAEVEANLGGIDILLVTTQNDEENLLLQVGCAPARLYREYVAAKFSVVGRLLEFLFLRPFVLGASLKAVEMLLEVWSCESPVGEHSCKISKSFPLSDNPTIRRVCSFGRRLTSVQEQDTHAQTTPSEALPGARALPRSTAFKCPYRRLPRNSGGRFNYGTARTTKISRPRLASLSF